jgi:hypothetical protein
VRLNLPKHPRDGITLLVVIVGIGAMAMTVLSRTPPSPSGQVASAAATSRASAAPVPAFSQDGNFIRNSSFETDVNLDGLADEWGRLGVGAEFTLDPSARYGDVAQRISMRGVPDPIANFAALQQHVTLAEEGAYIISVDYRYAFIGAPDRSRGAGITVYALAADNSYVGNGTAADWAWPPTDSWSRRSVRVRPPGGAVKLIIEFRLSVNGILWLDGAKLEKVVGG